ncbi:hypothetical protein [Demequina sp.]|uniref:hypothetical protein n=1 Tax=Demequina sp. TaxID=2050685 RepID=UPI0025ECC22D|nr:hypothetical protein [Demequina sp.]
MTEGAPPRPDAPAPDIAVIMTPLPRPRFLTALCAFNKVDATVLETSAGPMAVLADASPEATQRSARTVSAFVKQAEFLVIANRGGTVRVDVWKGSTPVRELSPGLALADAPGVVTTIITGAQTIDQVALTHPDKVHSTKIGRFKAYRELLAETKEIRRAES